MNIGIRDVCAVGSSRAEREIFCVDLRKDECGRRTVERGSVPDEALAGRHLIRLASGG
jgi:hypothetical protein